MAVEETLGGYFLSFPRGVKGGFRRFLGRKRQNPPLTAAAWTLILGVRPRMRRSYRRRWRGPRTELLPSHPSAGAELWRPKHRRWIRTRTTGSDDEFTAVQMVPDQVTQFVCIRVSKRSSDVMAAMRSEFRRSDSELACHSSPGICPRRWRGSRGAAPRTPRLRDRTNRSDTLPWRRHRLKMRVRPLTVRGPVDDWRAHGGAADQLTLQHRQRDEAAVILREEAADRSETPGSAPGGHNMSRQ